jgi:hypothetical protein
MKITRQIVADKIADYLHGKISQAALVDWAERAMMDADFDEADTELLADIVGRLGLADVAEFGLRWQAVAGATFTEGGAERERVRLGNPGNRDSGELSISDSEEFLRRLGYRAKVIVSNE